MEILNNDQVMHFRDENGNLRVPATAHNFLLFPIDKI